MTYNLEFKPSALKEWKKLGSVVQQQFKKKLAERLDNPMFPLPGYPGPIISTKLSCVSLATGWFTKYRMMS